MSTHKAVVYLTYATEVEYELDDNFQFISEQVRDQYIISLAEQIPIENWEVEDCAVYQNNEDDN